MPARDWQNSERVLPILVQFDPAPIRQALSQPTPRVTMSSIRRRQIAAKARVVPGHRRQAAPTRGSWPTPRPNVPASAGGRVPRVLAECQWPPRRRIVRTLPRRPVLLRSMSRARQCAQHHSVGVQLVEKDFPRIRPARPGLAGYKRCLAPPSAGFARARSQPPAGHRQRGDDNAQERR